MKIIFIIISLIFSSSLVAAEKKCSQFNTYEEAKLYYQAKKIGYKSLDKNHNGQPCEILLNKKLIREKINVKAHIRIYMYGKPYYYGEEFSSVSACKRKMLELNESHKRSDYSYKCESL